MPDPVRLYFGAPVLNGWVHASLLGPILELQTLYRENLQLALTTDSAICRGRNDIAAAFLRDERATHLFFVDADVGGWSGRNVRTMIESGLDLVAGAYRIKIETERYAANVLPDAHGRVPMIEFEGDRFVEALDAPTGCLLIRRRVLETMRQQCREIHYRATEDGTPHPGDRWNFFSMRLEQETGRYLTEDYDFIRRWQRLGGKAYVSLETSRRLQHFGTHPFVGDYEKFLIGRGVTLVPQVRDEAITNPATPVGLSRQQRRLLERQRSDGLVRSKG